ncbi:hypothetical protein JHK87_055937 [Glycine soja]|nr:hypothetical protein JHK87_055937 [Glycine soja]
MVSTLRSKHGSEEWGFVQVRPSSSGVGFGNFKEIGPLDANLKPRNFTWLRKANMLFVDNPIGTGYNFVEDYEWLPNCCFMCSSLVPNFSFGR